MLVGQSVIMMPLFAAPSDEALSRKQLEAVRGRRDGLAEMLGKPGHACFARAEALEQAQPFGRCSRFEHRRGAVQRDQAWQTSADPNPPG